MTFRRRTLSRGLRGLPVSQSEVVAGDVYLHNAATGENCFIRLGTGNTYSAANYTAIGVVAIPATHDVYGTGACGVVSLVGMSCRTPESGHQAATWHVGWSDASVDATDNYPSMCWGQYTTMDNTDDVAELANFSKAVQSTDFDSNDCAGLNATVYLPSTSYDNGIGDGWARYAVTDAATTKPGPSPYLTNGTRNPAYYQVTTPSDATNSLSDFDGAGNTDVLISHVTAIWSDATIEDSHDEGNYPSACCCRRFHTVGTTAGSWYLPACGELGYVTARLSEINTSLRAIQVEYGYGLQVGGIRYWTSTEGSLGLGAIAINMELGTVSSKAKYFTSTTRAFLKVGP